MGGANSESEDFVKSARRDVIDPFHIKMHFCIKCRCIGGIKISFTKKIFFWGGGTHITWPKATARRRVVWREAETTSIHFTK